MSQADLRQLIVFAVIFAACQVLFDYAQGASVTAQSLGGILITTGAATAVYAVFVRFLRNRKNPEE